MDCSVLSQQKGWSRWNQWVIQAATQKWKVTESTARAKVIHLKQKPPKQTDQHTERSILTLKDMSIEFILATEQIILTNCHHWSHIWKYTSSEPWVYNTGCKCKGSTAKPNSPLQLYGHLHNNSIKSTMVQSKHMTTLAYSTEDIAVLLLLLLCQQN